MSVPSRHRKQRGMAMAIVLFLLVALAMLTAAMFTAGFGSSRLASATAPVAETIQSSKAGLNVLQAMLTQNDIPLSTLSAGPVYLTWSGSQPWVSGDAYADPYYSSSNFSGTPQAVTLPSGMQSVFSANFPGFEWVRIAPEMVPGSVQAGVANSGTPRLYVPANSGSQQLVEVYQATGYSRMGTVARMTVREVGVPLAVSPLNPSGGNYNSIVPAALTLVGDSPLYELPHSNDWTVSGYDLSNPSAPPVIALGGSSDNGATSLSTQAVRANFTHYPGANATAPNPSIVNAVSTGMMAPSLSTVQGLQALVGQIRAAANLECGGTTACPTNAGAGTGFLDSQSPAITVVDGDYTLPSACGQAGSCGGVLLVTGTLSVPNNFQWDGLLMAVGSGVINFSTGQGGGAPLIRGAIFAANPCQNLYNATTGLFSPLPDASTNLGNCDQMGSAVLNTFNGGGNGVIQYDSALINRTLFNSTLSTLSSSGNGNGNGGTVTTTGAWQTLSSASFAPPS